ncbi:hypothetical protein [Evansella cellulosilytica]|uniref:Uncharacterized protein n=1 Tax=Evansella cellulosilytica (strain ATCC 21833 / DSM 2522 / FERM P-1141 / JCM 9156 / N-4) TaxID=649639 RepID=E6TWC1_EVAC2|nr:hypothetical protein [Evansella cellulosilytica]ADU31077.1 hypothetical protein Bcell_2824 [Evansella cellulosilytica DSM 2522]
MSKRNNQLENKRKKIMANYESEIKRLYKLLQQSQKIWTNVDPIKEANPNQLLFRSNEYNNGSSLNIDVEKNISILPYFHFVTFLPEQGEEETLVLGNFSIKNEGNSPLKQPIICIRISPPKAAHLSGKILMMHRNDQVITDAEEEWTHVYRDWKKRIQHHGEYWLQPLHCNEINPNETLTFSNFEIRIRKKNNISNINIDGYVFSEASSEGFPALNNISFRL